MGKLHGFAELSHDPQTMAWWFRIAQLESISIVNILRLSLPVTRSK